MRPKRIEILILLFTFALIIAVAAIGSITFSNLSSIERQSQKISQPNKTVITLKQLLSELRNSENCVRSYALYNNSDYLDEFQHSLERMDVCFDSLYVLQENNDEMTSLLDSTERLVEQKVLLLNTQLTFRNEQKVVNEVNRINVKLDKVTKKDTVIVAKRAQLAEKEMSADSDAQALQQPERKRNFFSRLFHRQKNPKKEEQAAAVASVRKKEPAVDCVHIVLNRGSIEEVKTEIFRVKKNQSTMFSKMKEEELNLLKEDKIIWSKLLNILTRLENKQNNELKLISADNIATSARTHRLTKIFGLLILIMLSFLGIFSVYYFYSERRHAAKLKAETDKSKMLARTRETFLANMSHEMRTPLNAITGFAEQMSSSSLNDEQRKQVEIIHSASKHLLNLINDVLDISKIEAEKIEFEKIPFDPLKEISEAAELLRQRAAHKNLALKLNFEKNIPGSVIGDPLRLRQVILNLLGNAIKFTDSGEVSVTVKPDHIVAEDKIGFDISVEDTGIGISEEMLPKVFENFAQADTSITRRYGGTGLGLSITKRIIELQGGSISISSQVGKGTRISFTVLYAINHTGINAEPECPGNFVPGSARGKRVLIADDELFNRILLITILKRWEMQYEEVQNGREVLEKLKENDYDLILMDVRMPEVSGIDASKIIRQMSDPKKSCVPIIALTAITSGEKRELCIEAGIDEVITKPYNEQELIRLVEKVLSQNHRDERKTA
jgi:signal transduction histidine kinase/ActR/RegA family two-component response regulator